MVDNKTNIKNNEFSTKGETSTANENNALIKQNLASIIKENNKQDLTIFQQESKTNWTEIFGEGKGNELYKIPEIARPYVGRDLTGLDKILFERIVKKVGTKQRSTTELATAQTTFNVINVVNAIPVLGNITGVANGLILTNTLMAVEDNLRIELEKTFTIKEVQEIVKEVGKEAGVDNSQLITKIMEIGEKGQQHYEEKLWKLGERIKELEADIQKEQEAAKKEKEKYETELEREKENTEREKQKLKELIAEAEGERTKQAEERKKLLETQNQLHSPDKVNLEELKEKHRKLELAAKTNEEILNAWKIKIDDYKLAIEQLKEEREREEQEKERYQKLFTLESKECGYLRVRKSEREKEVENLKKDHQGKLEIKDIEIENLKAKHNTELENKDKQLETKQIEIDTATNHFKEEENKRHAEWTQYRHWEGEVARKNHQLETLEKKNEKLTQELREAQENAKPGLTGWLAEKTGFAYVKDVFYGGFVFFLIVLVLWIVSFLWNWIIKPTIKNFTPNKKPQPVIDQSSQELEQINNNKGTWKSQNTRKNKNNRGT